MTTGHLLKDFSYGIPYLAKRKLNLVPYRPKARAEIDHIFAAASRMQAEEVAKVQKEGGKA